MINYITTSTTTQINNKKSRCGSFNLNQVGQEAQGHDKVAEAVVVKASRRDRCQRLDRAFALPVGNVAHHV